MYKVFIFIVIILAIILMVQAYELRFVSPPINTNFPTADLYVEGNTLATVIPSAGIFVKANFSTSNITTMAYKFYRGDNFKLTYNDTTARMCHLGATLSTSSSGANDVLRAKLYKNDIGLSGSLVETKLQGIGDSTSTAIHTMTTLSQGDNISLYITNSIDVDSFTIIDTNLFALCTNPT